MFSLIPGAYYVRPFGERRRFGVIASRALRHRSRITARNGQRRYLSESSSLAFVAVSAPLAYRLTDRWSIAGGPYTMYTDSRTKARVNNVLPEYGDGHVRLEESGAAFGWMVGAMYEPTTTTRFAASYRSSVDPKLEGTPSFNNLDPVVREALATADLLGTEVDVDFKIPAVAQAGVYTEFADKWSLTGDLIWLDMSEFGITRVSAGQDSISIRDDGFRDSWMGSAGIRDINMPQTVLSPSARCTSPRRSATTAATSRSLSTALSASAPGSSSRAGASSARSI